MKEREWAMWWWTPDWRAIKGWTDCRIENGRYDCLYVDWAGRKDENKMEDSPLIWISQTTIYMCFITIMLIDMVGKHTRVKAQETGGKRNSTLVYKLSSLLLQKKGLCVNQLFRTREVTQGNNNGIYGPPYNSTNHVTTSYGRFEFSFNGRFHTPSYFIFSLNAI